MHCVESRIKPSAVKSLVIDERWVYLTLASGHRLRWSSRGGVTVVGERIIEGLQAHRDDIESAVGVNGRQFVAMKDGSALPVAGFVECPHCHALNREGEDCRCQIKRDEIAKLEEAVKPE